MGDVVFFFKAESTIVAFCFRKKKKNTDLISGFQKKLRKVHQLFRKRQQKHTLLGIGLLLRQDRKHWCLPQSVTTVRGGETKASVLAEKHFYLLHAVHWGSTVATSAARFGLVTVQSCFVDGSGWNVSTVGHHGRCSLLVCLVRHHLTHAVHLYCKSHAFLECSETLTRSLSACTHDVHVVRHDDYRKKKLCRVQLSLDQSYFSYPLRK